MLDMSSGSFREYGDTESGHWRMHSEDAECDVHWRCTSIRGQLDDSGAARKGEAGCRAGRWPEQAPPGGPRMQANLPDGAPVGHLAGDELVVDLVVFEVDEAAGDAAGVVVAAGVDAEGAADAGGAGGFVDVAV
jgi:hypothetical protein